MAWHTMTRGVALALALSGLAPAAPQAGAQDAAVKVSRQHALSLVGTPKFAADFKHFDWINADAPKGGRVRQWAMGGFDSLNAFSVKGEDAAGLGLIYDQLMTNSPDEPSTEYGLIAAWVSHPDDYGSVTFGLRPEARWHDGKPITADDVIFSLDALKKANPRYAFYYKNVVKAEKTGDHEVTFTFDMKGNRELPVIVGQINVLPKHFWTANGADGQPRDITKSSLEMPLGSGPYKIKSVDPGRGIVYERVKDWWAKDLPVTRGQWNFDEIAYTYFRDDVPAFEAFKAGHIDVRSENSANRWATQYGFDAVTRDLVKKEALKHARVAPMQAFAFNTRRAQFKDVRVRRAFNLAFDFDMLNKSFFYDQYVRVGSYFANSELASSGLPQGRELEILNTVKDQVPPEVFTTEFKNPAGGADFRNNMREAVKLFEAAGWTQKGGKLVNAQGETLKAEFLLVQPDFERIVLPFIDNLKRLGVEATARIVDTSQYKRRTDDFDFDIVIDNFGQSHSPGNEQRDYWHSDSARRPGSQNSIGIQDKAIDTLVDRVIAATNRDDLVAATRALDRVLLWNFFVVPQWYYPFDRIAHWDVFGRPEKAPSQSPASVLQTWWIDPAKQAAVKTATGR